MSKISASSVAKILRRHEEHECPPESFGGVCVKPVAIADLPTRFGDFQVIAFENNQDAKEHTMLIRGDVRGKENIPVRLHSECLTGDGLGSLRCDCRDQLITALAYLGEQEAGALLYLRQEGRGIGFANKIRAYALQDKGYDTVEADRALGFSGDERAYDVAAHMLASLEVPSIRLMTNNPKKIEDLVRHGVRVNGRIPLEIPANEHNRFYLETKRKKAGHLLDLDARKINERLHEQGEEIKIQGGSRE